MDRVHPAPSASALTGLETLCQEAGMREPDTHIVARLACIPTGGMQGVDRAR